MSIDERDYAKALNRRDAYGIVVAHLISWFSTPIHEREPFEIDDYQAMMMDARLMDDDYQLTEMAKELFK